MGVYVKQYNNGRHSCGPIAVLNALKFQGRKFRRRHLPQIADHLRVGRHGTTAMDIDRCLKKMNLGWRMRRPNWKKIEETLIAGNGILFCANFWRKDHRLGHAMFIPGIQVHGLDVQFFLTNPPIGTHAWVDRHYLDRHYENTTDGYWFYPVWTIPPRRRK